MQHPDTEMCVAAMELARDHSPPFLFNHVMRTFAFGRDAGVMQGAQYDAEMLFLGSVLHDLGLVERFIGEDRFEIDGADAAASFLSRQGYSDRKIKMLETSPSERPVNGSVAFERRKRPASDVGRSVSDAEHGAHRSLALGRRE